MQWSGKLAAGSALAAVTIPRVHAAEDNTIRLALIGCGGRGSGAAADAFRATGGPVKLYAMADIFENRLNGSHKALSTQFPDQVDAPPERRFMGFDGYKKAIDCLRPGDVAMLCGYAGWRPVQLEYAVAKGVNAFMEKSFAVDPPAVRRIIKAGEDAEQKNLKIAAGLMCRHSVNRQELIKRIRDGALGDIQLIRAYRMQPVGPLGPKPEAEKELFWQIRNFIRFFWVAGGLWAEMDIHQIDELCWLKDAWPVSAHGVGGRAANSTDRSQNWDSFSVEWTFPDGTKAYHVVRYLSNCYDEFSTFVHGTKCAAQFSGNIHAGTVHTYKDQRVQPGQHRLESPRGTGNALAGGMECHVGRDPQRPAAQRGQAGRHVESGRHDGPGRDAYRPTGDLGPGHGVELPMVPEHRHHGREYRAARQGGRKGILPRSRARRVEGTVTRHEGHGYE